MIKFLRKYKDIVCCVPESYQKKCYDNGKHYYFLADEEQLVVSLTYLFQKKVKYTFLKKMIKIIGNYIRNVILFLRKCWVKKNNLISSWEKELLLETLDSKDVVPGFLEQFVQKTCVTGYRLLSEYYDGKIGFEKRPPKKLGKLKRLWYDLTLTVY